MVRVKFKYLDKYCRDGKWSTQQCEVRSVEECIKIYGLDQPDVKYEIISVEDIK